MVYGRMSAFGVKADIAKLQLLTENGVPPDSFARALLRTCDPIEEYPEDHCVEDDASDASARGDEVK